MTRPISTVFHGRVQALRRRRAQLSAVYVEYNGDAEVLGQLRERPPTSVVDDAQAAAAHLGSWPAGTCPTGRASILGAFLSA